MQHVQSRKLAVCVFAAILVFLLALPAFAAAVTGSVSASLDNCVINITSTVSADGTYYANIWDDGKIVQSIPFSATAGVPVAVQFNITQAADSGAPGIGIYMGTTPTNGGGSDTLSRIDPFFYKFPCASVCNVVIPVGAVVGSLPYPTQAFWAPGKVSPDVVLNAGTYWVVGEAKDDAGKPFYKIVLACQYLYVPVDTMGPSYQSPWSGQLLPTNAVN